MRNYLLFNLLYFRYWNPLQKYCCSDGSCNFYNSTNQQCRTVVKPTTIFCSLISQGFFFQFLSLFLQVVSALSSFLTIGLNMYGLYQNCSGLTSHDVRLFYAIRNLFNMMSNQVGFVTLVATRHVKVRQSRSDFCLLIAWLSESAFSLTILYRLEQYRKNSLGLIELSRLTKVSLV